MAHHRKSLLYITLRLPESSAATGDRYETEILRELSRDFEVHVASGRCDHPALYLNHAAGYFGYAQSVHVGNLADIISQLKKAGFTFDLIVFGKHDTHPFFETALRAFPTAITVVVTVDINYKRDYTVAAAARAYGISPRHLPLFPVNPDAGKRYELAFYQAVRYVIVISEEDRETLIRDGLPRDKVLLCRLTQPLLECGYNPDGRYLTFVGYAEHLPNYVSMKAFMDTVFPHLEGYLDAHGLRIAIIGRDYDYLYHCLKRRILVSVTGHLDLAEIRARYYPRTCLSLAPLIAGSGVKGKILEAFACGLPVVTTDIGLQGLSMFRDCTITIDMDDPGGAADLILHYLADRNARLTLSQKGFQRLVEYNRLGDGYEALRLRLRDAI
jgi:glycosyltransferase involved in cell wall biosynthesis